MTNKEKVLNGLIITYLIFLVLSMLMMFLCILLSVNAWPIVYISFGVFVIGYIAVCIMRMFTYEYVCPKCGKKNRMNFLEAIFSRRGDNTRLLKCKDCKNKDFMKRIPR